MKLSVVIPTHNRRDQVIAAVDSALNQTHAVDEVIVVDDCSTDDTVEHVSASFRNDARVRILALPVNGGACVARNKGIEAAHGDWIAFLDSDDLWDAEKIQAQLDELGRNAQAIACFCGMTAYRDGKALYELVPPAPFQESDLWIKNTLGSTSNAVVRADVLKSIGGFDPALPSCQDWDLFLRIAAAGPISTVPRSLVRYSEGNHVRISNSQSKVLAGHKAIFARILPRISESERRSDVAAEHALFPAELAFHVEGRRMIGLLKGLRAVVITPRAASFKRFLQLVAAAAWQIKSSTLSPIKRLMHAQRDA